MYVLRYVHLVSVYRDINRSHSMHAHVIVTRIVCTVSRKPTGKDQSLGQCVCTGYGTTCIHASRMVTNCTSETNQSTRRLVNCFLADVWPTQRFFPGLQYYLLYTGHRSQWTRYVWGLIEMVLTNAGSLCSCSPAFQLHSADTRNEAVSCMWLPNKNGRPGNKAGSLFNVGSQLLC